MYIKVFVEPNDYIEAFSKGEAVKIILKRFSFDQLGEVYLVLGQILISQKMEAYQQLAQAALKELVQNAIKATRKRIFYIQSGIDLVKEHDKGLEKFRDSFAETMPDEFTIEGHADFTAEVTFQLINKSILIMVKNQGVMTREEVRNVDFMLERGRKFSQVAEILTDEVKTREGGGLGLSMLVILMKNMGLPVENLYYKVHEKETVFFLKLN